MIAIPIFFLCIGILLLVKGAGFFVNKAELLGRAFHVPPIIVGMLVVAIGSSLPELVVSVLASANGHPQLGAENILGSNVTNIGLIVAVAALMGGVTLHKKTVYRDIPLSLIPAVVLAILWLLHIPVTPVVCFLFLIGYAIYTVFTVNEYTQRATSEQVAVTLLDVVLLLFGLIALIAGGEITLRYAEVLFVSFGWSQDIVGAVLLAFGTSLPELVTTVIAMLRKDGQLAIGGIIGSNVFNLLGIFGISSLIAAPNLALLQTEIMYMLGISVLFLLLSMIGKKLAISRFEGALLLMVYASYIVAIVTI